MSDRSLLPVVSMGLFIVITQVFAVYLSVFFKAEELQAFGDPESVLNPIVIVVFILLFTLFFLFMHERKSKWFIEVVIGLAVFLTLIYSFTALFGRVFGLGLEVSFLYALAPALFLFGLVVFHREWYVVNVVGLFVAAGVVAIFGVSFTVWPVILLLVVLAIYDAIAVYKTRHMISLAGSAVKMRIPILFVVPWERDYSFGEESFDGEGDRKAFYMGLGDAIIPSILTVSAYSFVGSAAAFGSFVGCLVGYVGLSLLVLRGKPQAGLPLLNSGAIVGFLVVVLVFGLSF
ncbi:presenilin family intramembrane aspartyl protease PSH [Methanonatronarchaeum sp. AMET-Sl]|uniref:presenilin family intramembrane aspartyl protease PSH n=1 Tax=Methanonatronarchaeum sp. AMET-Sl TaxID=3037654 RepID=UPI00244E296D|nr:presenilin family intramembrane aspartyl protease PSH [Methanonatronarchaeum sp. AMET-Sl]WGI16721.1 presenilin family intramembrane aspartyl protease [Methanonatronarchaeum sp. AMET-Sl]